MGTKLNQYQAPGRMQTEWLMDSVLSHNAMQQKEKEEFLTARKKKKKIKITL